MFVGNNVLPHVTRNNRRDRRRVIPVPQLQREAEFHSKVRSPRKLRMLSADVLLASTYPVEIGYWETYSVHYLGNVLC